MATYFMLSSFCSFFYNCEADVRRNNCTLYDLDLSSKVLQYDTLSNYTMKHRYDTLIDAYHLLCGEILQGNVL